MSNIKIIGQYIKDLSFEVPNAPKVFLSQQPKPDISISINIDAVKVSEENLFEVSLRITADAVANKERLFLCEVVYSGVFAIQNSVEEEMLEQILLIYCPNLLFPFIRKVIASNTVDGGFPPLMLDPIDFADLYDKRKKATSSTPISDTKN
ncbi:MAG: protein-export chaperone SecB [Pelagibacterales bacterium]|nr:protein-export chaperone SecB [Pelagibacterales bacterium]